MLNRKTKRRKWIKAKTQSQEFSEWFKDRAMSYDVSLQLKEFSRDPNTVAKRLSGYHINSYCRNRNRDEKANQKKKRV